MQQDPLVRQWHVSFTPGWLGLMLALSTGLLAAALAVPVLVSGDSSTTHTSATHMASNAVTVTVHATVVGTTTTYIGATEAGVFFIDDLTDLGINTYRMWTKMDELEWWDDDDARATPAYSCTKIGTPTIAQIKADQTGGFTNTVPWDWWTEQFTGTYYTWSGNSREEVISQCVANGITPVLVLRARDDGGNPNYCGGSWAPTPNPTTAADLNEWWEHCFAVAYWLNVLHDYGITHFEVLNEPDYPGQGWQEYGGTTAEYVQMVQHAFDAVKYANDMVGIETYIHAPVVANYNSTYVADSLDSADDEIQGVDYHIYADDPTASITGLRNTVVAHNPDGIIEPIWVSEWGTFSSSYDDFNRAMLTANQLLTFSEQGGEGVKIFGMYDWGSFSGLLDTDRNRTETYYAFRLMTRGLVGGKEQLAIAASGLPTNTRVMATRDEANVHVILLNDDVGTPITATIDLSEVGIGSGIATVYEYSVAHKDQVVATPTLATSVLTFTVPANGVSLAVVPRPVDLRMSKTVTPTVAAPGQFVTYTLAFSHAGSGGIATSIVITDVVPISLTNVRFASSGATVMPTGSVSYTWRVEDLAPGEGGIITVTGVVSAELPAGYVFTNTATISATALDTNSSNNSHSAELTVSNVAPLAVDDDVNTDEDTSLTIPVLTNDGDANGDTLSISTVGVPVHGSAAISGTTTVVYTPTNRTATYSDAFTYTVFDGALTDMATVTVTIAADNDAPAFTSTPVLTATEEVTYTYAVTAADVDTGDALTVTAPVLSPWLTLTNHCDGTATLSGMPANADIGDHDVSVQVWDTAGLTNTQTFTITVNEKPMVYIYLPLILRNHTNEP